MSKILEAKLAQRETVIEEQRKTIAALRAHIGGDWAPTVLSVASELELCEELTRRGVNVKITRPRGG